ncbi:MAG: RecQ family ATP-dependent DNA helicase, partial [Treponemataceae bacterium]
MTENEHPITDDPVSSAAKTLMGVDYLFPYQRLVVANILEAAEAVGMNIKWPTGTPVIATEDFAKIQEAERAFRTAGGEGSGDAGDEVREELLEMREDSSSLGRQIVILPTGAGKSLCFQLPALLLSRPTLVLFPILSLMSDQFRRLKERGFSPVMLRGGQDTEERRKIWNRLASGDAQFVIANPEVLLTESVMARLPSVGFAHLVIDEAHCVSEWGESFRPSYLRVAEILKATAAPLATAFTATASPAVLEKIRDYVFGDISARSIIGNPDRPNIDYSATGTILRDRTIVDLVTREAKPAIVFCASRARTERLARLLRAELPSVETRFYHAGLTREEKDDVEKWFFASQGGVLTATCAYGMGVDKANIRTVIHRDCPQNVEAYLQESGRGGRDGKPARAVLLW